MVARTRCGQMIRVTLLGIIVLAAVVWWPGKVGATARLAEDLEVQAWYRVRNTFQTDGNEHFDWVQWRNEAFVWLTWEHVVESGKFKALGDLQVPFVNSAGISARYRARVDPVYYLREHYRNLYDSQHRADWFEPENSFRDVYIDFIHGNIGPGRLSTRWGYQQIVWGESDLYRSLDIINPLRIDQNFPIGEKFDEFRSPILAMKFLYEIGNIGQSLSDVAFEGWYTPRFREVQTDLIDEGIYRIQFQERGCLGADGRLLDYTLDNCGRAGTKFLPYRPFWLGNRRIRHPWSLSRAGNNSDIDSGDYFCVTQGCEPDVPGARGTLLVNLPKGKSHHHSRGTDPEQWGAGGIRLLAKSWLGVDFSLNYLYVSNPYADTNPNHPTLVYGDGVPGAVGTFREGLLRCLSASGKAGVGANGRTNSNGNPPGGTIQLIGSDLGGYDWPERRLNADGTPRSDAKQKHATRAPLTVCTNGFNHKSIATNVFGLTATYNDFDYTGAVFRLEESFSTKEGLNKRALGYGKTFAPSPEVLANYAARNGKILVFTPVWRSMVGFDLVSALGNYRPFAWSKRLPGQFGTQQSFFTFQWLMQYNFDNITNNMCNWNFAMGIGERGTGCITNRWNHFLTFAWSGNGFFNGKLEQRTAIALEPRGQQWLFYGQWWWRQFMNIPIDLSFGTSWFPGSRHDNSWTLLNYFVNRNLLWVEGTYYLL